MIKLINQNTLDKIEVIENINRNKEADIVKLFLQEVAELKGERVPMQITGIENVNKVLAERDERQTNEMADCIILWLQMDKDERWGVVNKHCFSWISNEIEEKLMKSDPFLTACINYKVERTLERLNRGYYG